MSHFPSSSISSQATLSPYQGLPDDVKADIMKRSSLKQLAEGVAKSDKTSNRIVLDLVRTLALELIQVVDTGEELWRDLNLAISGQASDSKVHEAFKSVIKTCGFEDVPLGELAFHIQTQQASAARCGICLSDYQKILVASRSKTVSKIDVENIVSKISRAKGLNVCEFRARLLSEREAALAFVQKSFWNYEKLSLKFKADIEITLAAIAQNREAWQFVSPKFKLDKEFALALLKKPIEGALEFVSPEFKTDKEVVLAAVTQDGYNLGWWASPKFKADKEVVMAAVTQKGTALQYARSELQADKEIVLAAVTQNGSALQYASVKLQADKDVVLAAVTEKSSVLQYACPALKADREVVLAAVRGDGAALSFASPALQADREVVLAAVTQNGRVALYASKELQEDPDILAAIHSYFNRLWK